MLPITLLLLLLFFLLPPPPLTLSLNQEGLFLQQFKHSLSDPSDALSNWNGSDDTPCNWSFVKCHPSTGVVTSLNVSNALLSGPLPAASLCRLASLSSLSLSNNSITSSVPSELAACHSLRYLDLSSNLLTGTVPDFLPDLVNLRYLNLSMNNFSGDIPESFGRFRRLEFLILFGNLLNGTFPPFLGNISTLKYLHLAYNPFLPSEIPSQLGNLTNLEWLWLSGCNLVGGIPSSISGLTRLTNLELSYNSLRGTIPSWITVLKSLVQIELYNNSFSGYLPAGMSNLTELRSFDASTNNLEGIIPDELCGLPLESLNLAENHFTGILPQNISLSPNLYELKLFDNRLSGPLPFNLGNNSFLQTIDVSYNQFSGVIPPFLCFQGALQDLLLVFNMFSGKIPESLGKCKNLNRIRVSHNRLYGEVPSEIWGLPDVYLLDLIDNSLSGNISRSISTGYALSNLMISKNHFTGSLPDEIGLLTTLVEFSASDNKFTGQIPSALLNLTQLGRLDLNKNELSGKIPVGISSWNKLNDLNLAENKLSGEIPAEIGSLPALNYLDLSGNYFSGKIPVELQNLKLNLLNLSNNLLSGTIPPMYAKKIYRESFLGNPGLCGDIADLCPRKTDAKGQRYLWTLRSIFILAGLVFIIGVVWFYIKYRKFRKTKKGLALSKWKSFHKLGFSEVEILECLDDASMIGIGSSGKVYKVVLSNKEIVAVKKLWGGKRNAKEEDVNFDPEKDEFEAEIETLGKIRHKNIVRLWCCFKNGDVKLLVYEYMPNGSLGDLLHSNKGGTFLDWQRRYKIALDAAEGLSYLHHDCDPPIVHRDVKSNNILLDEDFGARVSDFGVAKVVGKVSGGVESMSVIAGSCGYIAPEYAYTLRVNEKSDIYSFGVVILELITGRKPIEPEFVEKDLVRWVSTTLDQSGVEQVVDRKLDSNFREEISKVLDIGLLCVSPLPINRPSMRRVVKMLQEVGAEKKKLSSSKKEGKLSPYYYEDSSNHGSVI